MKVILERTGSEYLARVFVDEVELELGSLFRPDDSVGSEQTPALPSDMSSESPSIKPATYQSTAKETENAIAKPVSEPAALTVQPAEIPPAGKDMRLEVGKEYSVVVNQVDSVHEVWVSRTDLLDGLEALMDRIEEASAQNKLKKKTVVVGELCIAR